MNHPTFASDHDDDTAESGLIRALCPPEAAVATLRGNGEAPPLFPEEEAAVANALDTRRREFALGRACAREALTRLGVEPGPIPMRADRAPVWPDRIVGTITHTRGFVAAAVARESEIAALGMDMESRAEPMKASLDRLIRTPGERERMSGPGFGAELDTLRVVFSAKESVHKCVAPLCGITLGFHDVEVDLDVAGGRFSARLVRSREPELPDLDRLIGRFAVTSQLVIAVAVILGVSRLSRAPW